MELSVFAFETFELEIPSHIKAKDKLLKTGNAMANAVVEFCII
jgi:hypothetical protein